MSIPGEWTDLADSGLRVKLAQHDITGDIADTVVRRRETPRIAEALDKPVWGGAFVTTPTDAHNLAIALRAMAATPPGRKHTARCVHFHRGCSMRAAADMLDEFADAIEALAVAEGVTA